MDTNRDDPAAAAPSPASPPAAPVWPPPSIGWLEVALPLWRRRWRLVFSALALGLVTLSISLFQPVRFTSQASFVVTGMQRPSQQAAAQLAGLSPMGASPIDLQMAMLRSRSIADQLIERFELVRAWELGHPSQARAMLARRMDLTLARREGVIYVEFEDDHPQRAAALANQSIEELRLLLRRYALDDARQRREFYEAQLKRARDNLGRAQAQLQASGYDRAALRTEPRAAAEAYARQQAEIAAAEVRLAATRRIRADQSPEVLQVQAEIAALKRHLATMEAPRDEGPGAFVSKLREFRYAESLVDSLSRQLEAARFDEDAEPTPLQVLDIAQPAAWPSKPRPVLWLAAGLLAGFVLQAVWVLVRHRGALAERDPHYLQRLALVQSVLPARRSWRERWPFRRLGRGSR